jgi:hypothetical protein
MPDQQNRPWRLGWRRRLPESGPNQSHRQQKNQNQTYPLANHKCAHLPSIPHTPRMSYERSMKSIVYDARFAPLGRNPLKHGDIHHKQTSPACRIIKRTKLVGYERSFHE